MKITKLESLHADGGFRNLDFLKISTDDGLVGWSEYNESFGGMGLSSVIEHLAPARMAWERLRFSATSERVAPVPKVKGKNQN